MAKAENKKQMDLLKQKRESALIIPYLNRQNINLDELKEVLERKNIIYTIESSTIIKPEDYQEQEPEEYPIVHIGDENFNNLKKVEKLTGISIEKMMSGAAWYLYNIEIRDQPYEFLDDYGENDQKNNAELIKKIEALFD